MKLTASLCTLTLALCSCQGFPMRHESSARLSSPQEKRVTLDSSNGWSARLLWRSDSGVWTVKPFDVLPSHAGPEIIALDDRGRCVFLNLNAAKVSEWQTLMDGEWLGALTYGDIDPLHPGPELYTAGAGGKLYQVITHPHGGFDTSIVRRWPEREIHTLFSANLDPQKEGEELYACLLTGEVVRLDPGVLPGGEWEIELAHTEAGRIRDAVVYRLPGDAGDRVVCVGRSGRVVELRHNGKKLDARLLYSCPQGLARIAKGVIESNRAPILYVVGDDGGVRRLEQVGEGNWRVELIYAGPIGARGVAAGRFDEDTQRETVALFGYSGKVEILRRETDDSWSSETIFTDEDKGHWLSLAELDDRNGTHEIVISGYSGRVVLLSRPPMRP